MAFDSKTFALSKVPQVALAFWVVKILATTVGETGGDALPMTLNLGCAVSRLIFLAFFAVTLTAQVSSGRYHPVYWAVVVATSVETTTSDYLDRTVGLGYVKSSAMLLRLLTAVLVVWHFTTGEIAFDRVTSRTDQMFYWVTILVFNTLGTALGDFTADTAGLGLEKERFVFVGLILLVAVAYFIFKRPASVFFWSAYVLTRPLGATLGDTLPKPHERGLLSLGRISSSLAWSSR